MGDGMKLPSIRAERMEVVTNGLANMKERMAQLERYASVIPHKRRPQVMQGNWVRRG